MLHAIGSKKNLERLPYYLLVADVLEHTSVQALKHYRHHIRTTRFQHCVNVSYHNYLICKFLHWDAASAARAGLLHDLYFYETSDYKKAQNPVSHNLHHPQEALQNAVLVCPVNAVEMDMIQNHMWPAAKHMPHSKEGYVIVIVDKYCAIMEYVSPLLHSLLEKLRRQHDNSRK